MSEQAFDDRSPDVPSPAWRLLAQSSEPDLSRLRRGRCGCHHRCFFGIGLCRALRAVRRTAYPLDIHFNFYELGRDNAVAKLSGLIGGFPVMSAIRPPCHNPATTRPAREL